MEKNIKEIENSKPEAIIVSAKFCDSILNGGPAILDYIFVIGPTEIFSLDSGNDRIAVHLKDISQKYNLIDSLDLNTTLSGTYGSIQVILNNCANTIISFLYYSKGNYGKVSEKLDVFETFNKMKDDYINLRKRLL